MQVYTFTIMDVAKEMYAKVRKSDRRLLGHADEIETSIMLAICPELVEMSKAVREEPALPEPLSFESNDLAKVSFAWTAKELTKTGVIGDPTVATVETGRILLNYTINTLAKTISGL
jgi:creatinine amidohydrolase